MTESLTAISSKLTGSSGRKSAATSLEWPPSMNRQQWFMSPELISIYGTAAWEQLTDSQQKTLSFFETVNLFSLNIHGERSLIQGMTRRMYRKNNIIPAPYLHHFVGDENEHMEFFGKFCLNYAGKIYADKKLALPEERPQEAEDFLFFARVMIFEEIVDTYNLRIATDDRVEPLSRAINRIHHLDEARHLAFGRRVVLELFEQYRPRWKSDTLEELRDYLGNYVVQTFREYYNPDAYRDAGLVHPYEIRKSALADRGRRDFRKIIAGRCIDFLTKNSILLEAPEL